jgi:putative transcriptional regulator
MKSLRGHLLIAARTLVDPNFFRSVVLMVQHGKEGAMGLVLNRPLDVTVKSAWEQVSEIPCDVAGALYQGGPCEGPLMVVHDDEEASEVQIMPGVHFSTGKDSIEHLVGQNTGNMKFFVGYSGWSPGQLERELEDGGWLVVPASAPAVFGEAEDRWDALVRDLSRSATLSSINPKLIPEDPSVN